MADKKDERSTQDINFDNARKIAQINHDNTVTKNVVGGYEGVEVRDLQAKEVINPVRNGVTGELEDDTRAIKQSDEEVVGATGSDTGESA